MTSRRGMSGKLALHAGGDRVEERGVGRDEDRLRQLVVLGLREEIHRHPVRVGAAVAHDHDLGRAGDHVDADDAEHLPLGGGDVGVARADDLVHRRYRLRAVGERGDRLRAADREHAVDAADRRRREHELVALAAGRGHRHDDFAHARHLRRHGIHDHRRRVGGLAAGHVDADAVERVTRCPSSVPSASR